MPEQRTKKAIHLVGGDRVIGPAGGVVWTLEDVQVTAGFVTLVTNLGFSTWGPLPADTEIQLADTDT